jgi:hypothetical protein
LPAEWFGVTPQTAGYFAEVTNALLAHPKRLRDEHGVMIGN